MSPRTIAATVLALALSACGKLGELDRPGPLNGQGRATATQADEQVRQAQDPGRPVNTVDPRDRDSDPAPIRTTPIQGTNPGASAMPPQGALPDPYANPR